MSDSVTYVGHATVRLELGGTTLLTDPLLRGRFLHVRRHAAKPALGTLSDIDGVLVSHLHPDHLDFASMRGLSRETELVVPAGGADAAAAWVQAGQRTAARGDDAGRLGRGRRHPGGPRWPPLPPGPAVEALGFDLRAPASRVYFAGDTDLFEEMAELAEGSTWLCFRSAAGGRGWAPATSIPAELPRRRR